MTDLVLRPYQEDGITQLRAGYAAGRRAPLYVLPTGAGKTVTFGAITQLSAARGKRVLILVHRRELLKQASDKLHWAGVEHGIIAAGYEPHPGRLVQVASVQTLVRREMRDVDLIISDECHHARAATWRRILEAQPKAKLLGVTATPIRLDGKGLGVAHGGFFDYIVCGPSIRELVKQGFLSDARYYVPDERGRANMHGVKKHGGDYSVGDAAKRVNRREITGSAVDQYTKYARGLPAIAFCTLVEHAESVARDFRLAGYKSWCVHGGTPKEERDRLIAGLGDGSVEVLTSCELISEGLDVPALGAVILLRPTASLGMAIQQVGRGMRPSPGKTHLVVLDHVGNIARHGRPDFERIWTLEGVEHDLITCWHCKALNEENARSCSSCGSLFKKKTWDGPKREAPEVVAGTLVQLSPERIAAIRAMSYRQVVTTKLTEQELKLYARLRGYKPGWVWYQMRTQPG